MPTIIITARPLPAVADLIPPIPGLQVVGCGDVESHTAIEPPGAALGLAVYAAALGGVLSRLVGATGEPATLTVDLGAPEDPFPDANGEGRELAPDDPRLDDEVD